MSRTGKARYDLKKPVATLEGSEKSYPMGQTWGGKEHSSRSASSEWGCKRERKTHGNVELSDQDKNEDDGTEPRAPDTESRLEGELLERVTLDLPRSSEPNVGDGDGEPGEESRETRKCEEPVEDLARGGRDVDVRDRGEDEDGNGRVEGSSGSVDVAKDLGSVAGLGEGGEGSRTGVDAGHADGEDGDADGDVDKMVETADVGSAQDEDERRGVRPLSSFRSSLQSGVVVGDEETLGWEEKGESAFASSESQTGGKLTMMVSEVM